MLVVGDSDQEIFLTGPSGPSKIASWFETNDGVEVARLEKLMSSVGC